MLTRARIAGERGTMNNGLTLLALAIIIVAVLAGHGRRALIIAAVIVGVIGWMAFMIGSLPFFDRAIRATRARRMAKRLKGSLSAAEVPIWGGKDTEYTVAWDGPRCRFELELDVSGVLLRGLVPTAAFPEATCSVRSGVFTMEGAGAALAERVLDEKTRVALIEIDRLKKGALSLHLGGSVFIYKQQYLSVSKTAQFVSLGTGVVEHAFDVLRANT